MKHPSPLKSEISDRQLDEMIARSVSRLDSSPGLPSNFAYRMAELAAERRAQAAERRSRRERLTEVWIPVAAAVAAIAAVIIAVPWPVMQAMAESVEVSPVSPSALPMWGIMGGVGVALGAFNLYLRRRLLRRLSHSHTTD